MRRRARVLALVLVLLVPVPAEAAPGVGAALCGAVCPEPPPDDPGLGTGAIASDGAVAVTVYGSGVTLGGGSFEIPASSVWVPPVCYYERGPSGHDYWEWWASGDADELMRLFPQWGRFTELPAYEQYQDDDEGAWYRPECDPSRLTGPEGGYAQYRLDFLGTHSPVYVPVDTDPPPVPIPPEILAQVAFESMDLPEGTIRWNPDRVGDGGTVVNFETWVSVEGGPTEVSVTAGVPGTWARVDAQLAGLELSAPGADPASCPDTGVRWTAEATGTSCSVTFFRSSANQPVKPGYSVPTATLTATASWTAAWVSSLDATSTPLPTQTVTSTAEVPVAEIQALVTTS